MLKIFGKEFTGRYFKNWNPQKSIRVNLIERVRHSPHIYGSDIVTRCKINLNADEGDMELIKLQEFLRDIAKQKENAIREAKYELSDIKESLVLVDDAVSTLLIKQAWNIGYENAEDDLKPKKRVKTA